MNTDDKFSPRDAASMIVMVRRAPLQDMQHAEAVKAMLDRFAKWYEVAAINAELDAAEFDDGKIRSIE